MGWNNTHFSSSVNNGYVATVFSLYIKQSIVNITVWVVFWLFNFAQSNTILGLFVKYQPILFQNCLFRDFSQLKFIWQLFLILLSTVLKYEFSSLFHLTNFVTCVFVCDSKCVYAFFDYVPRVFCPLYLCKLIQRCDIYHRNQNLCCKSREYFLGH